MNPPAERRLKKATPRSQASTNHPSTKPGSALDAVIAVVEPLAASLPLAVGLAAAASGDDFAVSGAPECPSGTTKKVTRGASSINTNAPTPIAQRVDGRRQSAMAAAAMAASAVPCHRKCSRAQPKECIAEAERRFTREFIAGSFHIRRACGAVR